MNKHQVTGRVKEAAGAVQKQAGKLVGSDKQQAKGEAREQVGKVQKKAGDLKENVKGVLRESGKH